MDRMIYQEILEVAKLPLEDVGNHTTASAIVQGYATMRSASISQDGYWPEPAPLNEPTDD